MNGVLTIGDFSRVTHLSIKTLRRYHESGLLEPADVDRHTGYRYYSSSQIPTAQVISRFRELGMPLREVAAILRTADPEARSAVIRAHLGQLERQLDQTRAAVSSLRRLLDPAPPPLRVEVRKLPELPAAAVSATVDLPDVLTWYADAMTDIDRELRRHGSTITGPAGGLYDNELFTAGRGRVVVYVPTTDAPHVGRVEPLTVPPAELALAVHAGSHDDIDVTYGELGAYVANNALAIAGPVRETYLIGPRDTGDESAWRTEIGWPVFVTSQR